MANKELHTTSSIILTLAIDQGNYFTLLIFPPQSDQHSRRQRGDRLPVAWRRDVIDDVIADSLPSVVSSDALAWSPKSTWFFAASRNSYMTPRSACTCIHSTPQHRISQPDPALEIPSSSSFDNWQSIYIYWAHLHPERLNCWINNTIRQWYRQAKSD